MSRTFLFLAWAILGAFLASATYAADREYALKAGLIYNFAIFSEGSWFDPGLEEHYSICSDSADFVTAANGVLKGKQIKGRKVKVISLPDQSQIDSLCHTVFYSANSTNPPVLPKHAMLIGEAPQFIDVGGHISFFIARGKIRFEINPDALNAHGIRISSKVIRLGKVKMGAAR